jgi:hypothetical protein
MKDKKIDQLTSKITSYLSEIGIQKKNIEELHKVQNDLENELSVQKSIVNEKEKEKGLLMKENEELKEKLRVRAKKEV